MIGYGNSMFLATHGILARAASGGGVDPDAQAFITAASITDPTQQSAINQLVVDLKGYNIWTKMQAIYPMVGGTSTSTSYNLKNTAQFQISWQGGVTWNANGVQFGGVNGYGITGLTPSTSLNLNNGSLSYYSRTNSNISGVEIGARIANSDTSLGVFGATPLTGRINTFADSAQLSITDTLGFYQITRTGGSTQKVFKNTSNNLGNITTSTAAITQPIYLGCLNNNGAAAFYSNRQCAFASIGDGLTDTEAANFYTAVQAFQVTLGRSIGTQTVSDADAQAFVTNAGIIDQVEANAINNLVIGLKADGLWTKMKAVYPFVGGTSTTNSYNLRNTAQNQITWSGGVTHSSNGVQFGGVNGYGNTNLNLTALNKDNIHFSFYSRTNNTTQAFDMGQTGFTGNAFSLLTHYGGALKGRTILSATGSDSLDEATYTNTTGLLIGTRQNSNNIRLFRNAVKTESNSINSVAVNSGNIFIGARNQLTIGGAANYTNRQAAFISIGDNLTDTDAANLTTRVNTFQTALNRNV